MDIKELYPPILTSLLPVLEKVPNNLLPWIAEMHVKYLDDRIHKIVPLTNYLSNCSPVEKERIEFIEFIEGWTKSETPDLIEYTKQYQKRYFNIRKQVERQCDVILSDQSIWSSNENLKKFWNEFAFYNEIDSLFGMFLTSGRWYVNAMLPIVKVIIHSTLPVTLKGGERNAMAYHVAKRVITPRYATVPPDYNNVYERKFSSSFIPMLQFYDRKLLFLFDILSKYNYTPSMSMKDFVNDISSNQENYKDVLKSGIYPPFAWHEFIASKKPRKESVTYEFAKKKLENNLAVEYRAEFETALIILDVFKEYELNYNNYNYKGKFGLVSKLFYYETLQKIDDSKREDYLNAILLDQFFEALEIVNYNLI